MITPYLEEAMIRCKYEAGAPIDIPAGRWIDLRVEVPGGDEAEFIPWLEGEVIQEP